jgi:hypothetical protein
LWTAAGATWNEKCKALALNKPKGDAMSETLSGGCLCGAIRYEVTQALPSIVACHCTHCQKASGSGASHNAILPTEAFQLLAGQTKCFSDTAENGNRLLRHFCGDCGSPLFSQRENAPGVVVLKVGSLDDSSAMQVVMNIWTRSARPWMHIDPASAQHAQGRPVPA